MRTKPAISDDIIMACLHEHFGLHIAQVAFLPIGWVNNAVYRVRPSMVRATCSSYDVGSSTSEPSAELRDSTGTLIAVYPNPAGCTNACYALIPISPLRYATTYTAHVRGQVDNVAFDNTWAFTTTDCTYRLGDGTCIG
jgi:hypothetical protein